MAKKFKDLPFIQKAGIIGGGTLLGYIILKKVTAKNIKAAPVDYGQIPTAYTDPTGAPVLWDPDPLAKKLTALEGWNLYEYSELMPEIYGLQPEQTKLLYNHYNEYYAQDEPTLTKLIENEWEYSFNSEYQKAVAHLKSFGLNEGFNWGAIGQALTDPDAALNFPVKFPPIGLDKQTRNTITGAASIIAAGWIAAALLKK
jgi:hypothetical protein